MFLVVDPTLIVNIMKNVLMEVVCTMPMDVQMSFHTLMHQRTIMTMNQTKLSFVQNSHTHMQ